MHKLPLYLTLALCFGVCLPANARPITTLSGGQVEACLEKACYAENCRTKEGQKACEDCIAESGASDSESARDSEAAREALATCSSEFKAAAEEAKKPDLPPYGIYQPPPTEEAKKPDLPPYGIYQPPPTK